MDLGLAHHRDRDVMLTNSDASSMEVDIGSRRHKLLQHRRKLRVSSQLAELSSQASWLRLGAWFALGLP
jgi:hypothetical protein